MSIQISVFDQKSFLSIRYAYGINNPLYPTLFKYIFPNACGLFDVENKKEIPENCHTIYCFISYFYSSTYISSYI